MVSEEKGNSDPKQIGQMLSFIIDLQKDVFNCSCMQAHREENKAVLCRLSISSFALYSRSTPSSLEKPQGNFSEEWGHGAW